MKCKCRRCGSAALSNDYIKMDERFCDAAGSMDIRECNIFLCSACWAKLNEWLYEIQAKSIDEKALDKYRADY